MPQEPTTAAPELGQTATQETQLGTEPGQATAQPTTAPAVSVEQLQRDLAAANQKAEEYQSRFTQTQQAYTRSQQALSALNGTDPAQRQQSQDPLAPYVDAFRAKGYAPKDARDVAEVQYRMVQDMIAPMQQQYSQQLAAVQSQTFVDDAMYQASVADNTLFSDQRVQETVRQGLRHLASQGGQVDAATAEQMAVLAAHNLRKQAAPQMQQQPGMMPQPQFSQGQQQPQPFARGMNYFNNSFPPPAPAGPAPLSPEAQAVDAELKARYGLK